MPLDVPPTFVMSKTAVPLPYPSAVTEIIRTERSAGVFGDGAGAGAGAGVGVGAGVGMGVGAGVGVGDGVGMGVGVGEGVGVVTGAGEIFTLALPCASFVACPELEVALGMKIMETGTSRAALPLRNGVTETVLSMLAIVKAAPQGIPFMPPAGPGVCNWRPPWHL